jgi:hypothetical protein
MGKGCVYLALSSRGAARLPLLSDVVAALGASRVMMARVERETADDGRVCLGSS